MVWSGPWPAEQLSGPGERDRASCCFLSCWVLPHSPRARRGGERGWRLECCLAREAGHGGQLCPLHRLSLCPSWIDDGGCRGTEFFFLGSTLALSGLGYTSEWQLIHLKHILLAIVEDRLCGLTDYCTIQIWQDILGLQSSSSFVINNFSYWLAPSSRVLHLNLALTLDWCYSIVQKGNCTLHASN